MSKKPTPELLGDEEFLRHHHVIEMSVGAIQVFRVAKIDDKNSHNKPATAGELFSGGFFYGADELLADVRKAGFPKYPTRVTMAELEKIAEQYVGAAPNIKDPKNLRASHAWVLANFAEAEYYRQKFMSEDDFINVWGTGVFMGRLVEWWVWRSQQHDKNAIFGRDTRESNRRKGEQSKRRPWAEILAERITSWEDIPTDRDDALETWGAHGEYRIFREGDKVICYHTDEKGSTERSLKRSSFEKRYLKSGKKGRGQ